MEQNREQLWAEALHEYRNGVSPRFPREYFPRQIEANRQHTSMEETLSEAVLELANGFRASGTPITTRAIRSQLSDPIRFPEISVRENTDPRVARVMKQSGYFQVRAYSNGVHSRQWIKEGTSD